MERRSNCPVNYLLEMTGDKWSFLIIRDMLFFQKKTYKDFLESNEGISTNILADKLHKLEEAGILEKYPSGNKSKFHYILTQKGFDLYPMLLHMIEWGISWEPTNQIPPTEYEKFQNDRNAYIEEIRERFLEMRHQYCSTEI